MLIPFKDLLSKYNFRPSGVFHIGGSTGQEAPDYFAAGVHNAIFIEAIPSVFETLKQNLIKYPKMVGLNHCISDKTGEVVNFNISNNEAQSSSMLEFGTHRQVHPEVRFIDHMKLPTITVADLLKKYELDLWEYDFLNIDLQGAEMKALIGMGEHLKYINYAYIEVNKDELYKGCPLIADIDDFMTDAGFKRVELEWCGNFGWGDAFYLRENIGL